MLPLHQLLTHHARYQPAAPAFDFAKQTFTYAEFAGYVNRVVALWHGLGLQQGDRVATLLGNGVPMMACYWAAAQSGVVIVPMSPLLQGEGLRSLLLDADCRVIIVDAETLPVAQPLRNELPGILDAGWLCTGEAVPAGFSSFQRLLEAADERRVDIEIDEDAAFNIMYSSGTTGIPKGIVHSHRVRALYGVLFAIAWRMTPQSVVLHSGSLVFNGVMLELMSWMTLGCRYYLHEKFDAEAVIEAIARHQVTHVVMVPSQIIAILNSPAFDAQKLQSLEMLHNVGGPLHLPYKQRINEVLPGRFYELYGLTEGFMTILDKHDAVRKVGSVGKPPAFFTLDIVDTHGRSCEVGETGEIIGKTPLLMSGYHGKPELTAAAIKNDWLYSGDLGYVDEDGFLYLVDRKKDMIISGGVNVYPKDIEAVVMQYPGVTDVAVVGMVHSHWGEAPVAAVLLDKPLQGEQQAFLNELMSWVNARVAAKFQRLIGTLIMQEFPKNVAGKVLKKDIREIVNNNPQGLVLRS